MQILLLYNVTYEKMKIYLFSVLLLAMKAANPHLIYINRGQSILQLKGTGS